jgi:hypothetical protein
MIDYNVVDISINDGLKNYEIASNKSYIHLLSSPAGANVKIKFNSNMGDEIPLKENYAIESSEIEKIYISADSVPDGYIKLGQSNNSKGFKIITAPTINQIEELGSINSFGTNLLNSLDKIINPYDFNNSIRTYNNTTSESEVTLINKTLTCDLIELSLIGYDNTNLTFKARFRGFIIAYLDYVPIFSLYGTEYSAGYVLASHSNKQTFKGVKGKLLTIQGQVSRDIYTVEYYLNEVNVK